MVMKDSYFHQICSFFATITPLAANIGPQCYIPPPPTILTTHPFPTPLAPAKGHHKVTEQYSIAALRTYIVEGYK
jgi:hypothetical protein